jgi:pyruvate,water dikinase
LKREIEERIAGYASPTEYYISKIVEGIATIAAAFWPKKVIVRLSDFKSNEYSNLLGGSRYEPDEKTRCSAFAAHRDTSHRNFTIALRSNAAR